MHRSALLFVRNKKHIIAIVLFAVMNLVSACEPTAGYSEYFIVYSSGYMKNTHTAYVESHSEEHPIEGLDLKVKALKDKKKNTIGLQLLKENKITQEYSGNFFSASPTRGELVQDNLILICCERWNAGRYKGYIDSFLKGGQILFIDLDSEKVTFNEKTGENELFLTARNSKCYFYYRGKESEKKLFGLITTRQQNAEVFYRDISDWKTKQTVYTFDYSERARTRTGNVGNTMNFYLYPESIKICFYAESLYAPLITAEELKHEEWIGKEDWSVEIPLETTE